MSELKMTFFAILLATLFMMLTSLIIIAHAWAHDWYPLECCHNQDCAPITKYDPVTKIVSTSRASAQLDALTRYYESKDNKTHACIRGGKVVCFFLPPSN